MKTFSTVFLLLVILVISLNAQDIPLSAARVAKLEETVRKSPKDLTSRTQLIRHYEEGKSAAEKAALQRHRLAYISNNPDEETWAFPLTGNWTVDDIKNPDYIALKNEWLKQLAVKRSNRTVRLNGFYFFYYPEPGLAEKIIKDGQNDDPDEVYFSEVLINSYNQEYQVLEVMPSDENEEEAFAVNKNLVMRKLLAEAKKALSIIDKRSAARDDDVTVRKRLLAEIARAYFKLDENNNAKMTAQLLLAAVGEPEAIVDFPGQNDVRYFQIGMSIVGRVALADGNIASAGQYLLNSVRSLNKNAIYSISVDNEFLEELLVAVGRKMVLEYLALFKPLEFFSDEEKLVISKWQNGLSKGAFPKFDEIPSRLF